MRQHNIYYKSHHSLGLLAPNRYESDLSNEVLYILVSQEAAKMFEVKVGGPKKIVNAAALEPDEPRAGRPCRFFYQPLTLTFCILAAS